MTHKILVVDDEAYILQVLSLKLRRCGYDVATAVDGEDALQQALESPVAIRFPRQISPEEQTFPPRSEHVSKT